jgi:hypothetical protein
MVSLQGWSSSMVRSQSRAASPSSNSPIRNVRGARPKRNRRLRASHVETST